MSNTANQVSINFQNKTKSLSETDLGFIFEPFMRGSNSKNTRGHGVGLSLTKRIIELHNGTLFTQMLPNNKVQFQLKLQKPIKNNN
jgi:signal transduction histidine kinase